MDDHLELPGVADVGGGPVVSNRLDAFQEGRPQFNAVGEGAPLRQDVAVDFVPPDRRRTFPGYARPDGRVGTRNYVALVSTVNCSANTILAIADHFRHPDALKEFPEVDGVIPRAIRGGNLLQMFNPRAPRKYGTSQEAVSFNVIDIYHPDKWRGIKFFEFRF